MSQASAHPANPLTRPALNWETSGQPIAGTTSRKLNRNFSDTLELTAAIASGNQEAFAVFYQNYFKFMFETARRARRFGDADEAATLDIVQDAMLRIIKSLRVPLQSEAQLQTYLRRTVYTVAIDHLRAETRREKRHQSAAANETVIDSEKSNSPQEKETQLEWLNAQLAALDDLQSNLMVMRYRFNWTLEKIGRTLGLSAGAVDSRINRTLNYLQKNAREEFNDE